MDRGLSPVVGVVLLVGVTIVLATTLGAVTSVDAGTSAPTARLSLTADASADRLTITHEGGETLSVRALDVTVSVAGDRLRHQPPVPFFATTGFQSGPSGPFNSAADPRWSAGERATLRLATTNDPLLDAGDHVAVTLRTEGGVVARLEATAR